MEPKPSGPPGSMCEKLTMVLSQGHMLGFGENLNPIFSEAARLIIKLLKHPVQLPVLTVCWLGIGLGVQSTTR